MNPNLRSWWDNHPDIRDFVARMIADKAWTPDIQEAVRARFGHDLVPTTVQLSRLRTGLARGRWTRPKPASEPEIQVEAQASSALQPEQVATLRPIDALRIQSLAQDCSPCPSGRPAPAAPSPVFLSVTPLETQQTVQEMRRQTVRSVELLACRITGMPRIRRSECLKRQVSPGRPQEYRDGSSKPFHAACRGSPHSLDKVMQDFFAVLVRRKPPFNTRRRVPHAQLAR